MTPIWRDREETLCDHKSIWHSQNRSYLGDNFYLKCGHLWRRVQFGVYSLWTVGNLCLGVGENLSIFFGLGFDFSDIRLKFDGIEKCQRCDVRECQ